MELPKIKKSEHGMLEGIKSKLGFADANPHYDDGYYDEGFDDYSEEYGEYGPRATTRTISPPTMLPVRVMSPMRP